MNLKWYKKHLPLKHTFTIAHQSRDVQESLIVEISDGTLKGLGEATTNPYYGITFDNMIQCLEKAALRLPSIQWEKPEELWEQLKDIFVDNPFAQCALDLAVWDLFCQKKGVKLYEYLGLDPQKAPQTNFTIGIDSIPKMLAKMKEVEWPLYKIKLGTDEDLEIVAELRKHTQAIFRIDANCAWTAEQAIAFSGPLKDLGVEFMEQPLPREDWKGMELVFQKSALPVIADESCIAESDVAKCEGRFHGINVKLVKCGGITPGLRMLHEAKRKKMKTMVGCMTESTVGISAVAHLSPMLDYVDMDGALLLAADIAEGVSIDRSGVHFPDRPGIGARLLDA